MNGTTRGTLGSIFGALQTLMLALIALFKTADKGITMLDVAVTDAQERQSLRSAVDMEQYAERYVREAARKLDEDRRTINEYVARSPEHRQGYQQAYDQLWAAVERRKQQRNTTLT